MRVEPISHMDVRGKVLLYIKFVTDEGDLLINIGEKTYEALIRLIEAENLRLSNNNNKKKEGDK